MAIGDSYLRKMDGTIPGMTWDQFVGGFQGPTGAEQRFTNANIGGIGQVSASRPESEQTRFSHGEMGSGFGNPTYAGDWSWFNQPVGDGTQNQFMEGPNNTVLAQNNTINTDSWWDSTGLILAAGLGFGGLAAAGGAFGGAAAGAAGGAGGAAGEGMAAGATGAFDLGGTVGGVAGAGGFDAAAAGAYGLGGGAAGGGLAGAGGAAVNDVGGLAALDSGAVASEGMVPGLTQGYGAAAGGLGGAGGAGGAGGGAGGASNPFSAVSNLYNNGLLGGSAADYWSLAQTAAPLVSGFLGSNAANSAAKTQADAANQANQLTAAMYADTSARNAPFVNAGTGAVNKLGNLNGLNGADAQSQAAQFMQSDPGYKFRLDQGNQAVERSAAARGGLFSGRAAKDLTNYSQGAASQEYGNSYGRLANLAQLGQSSANNQATIGQNYANMAGNNLLMQGVANSAGTMGSANAWSNALTQLMRQAAANGYYG